MVWRLVHPESGCAVLVLRIVAIARQMAASLVVAMVVG